MSENLVVEQVLAHAREQQKEHDWQGAAGSYKNALGLVSENNPAKIAEIHERSGHALFLAAMQADNVDQFKQRIDEAIDEHGKCQDFYQKKVGPSGTARTLRCHAMIAYLGFWLTPSVAEKKRLLDESWRLTKESLKKFEDAGEAYEYGETYNRLAITALFGANLEGDARTLEKTFREGLEYAEEAIRFLSAGGFPEELASAYVIGLGWLEGIGFQFVPDPDEQDDYRQKVLRYWKRAESLSEGAALLQLPVFSGLGSAGIGTDEGLAVSRRALNNARKSRNRLILGYALENLSLNVFWRALGLEDPDEEKNLLEEALQYAKEAKNHYSPILFTSPGSAIMWAESPYAEYYLQLARYEVDLSKRRDLLEKARDSATDQLKRAQDSGYPYTISNANHTLSKTLASLAKIEPSTDTKRNLLEEAIKHRNMAIKINERTSPYFYWDRGVFQNYLANIRSELVGLTENPSDKKTILDEAILAKETSLELCRKGMPWIEGTGSMSHLAWIGERQFEYGNLWISLHAITNDSRHLKKAAEAFEKAAEWFQRPNLATRMAECHWQEAQAYDSLTEHLTAADRFRLASKNYQAAAEKIPQLKEFYQDHASYMEAWSEIENARHYHWTGDYGPASEHYGKASGLHKSTKRWSFLASNYSAWSQVEKGEDLARAERSEDAVHAFEEAAKLFQVARQNLQEELSKLQTPDERLMVTELVKAADLRREYCRARTIQEEARILDKEGDDLASSKKYDQSAEILQSIAERVESDQDKTRIRSIVILSKAWGMMARAEAEASPKLYLEASRLFEEARELAPNKQAKNLALGHSRFCMALEAGARFADTRNETLHATAIQHLESAGSYYLKAGLENASEYTKASKLLFDAYLYMDEANKEKDPEKKTKQYLMAEKVLEASADHYAKAQYPAKREQVMGLLKKVKGERELALSLTEVFHAPAFISTRATLTTPNPTHEKPTGLERFENADVQASLITQQKNLKIGEDLDLEIELVNAGKGPAQLVKVEEIVPEGFEVTKRPESYRVEDSYLNMKGKRLDPLKTEEVKLVLKPKVQGQFKLKPRILYLDESGRYKSHEPEPIEVTVKELGISGWIKGR